jgi:hypothetical protein
MRFLSAMAAPQYEGAKGGVTIDTTDPEPLRLGQDTGRLKMTSAAREGIKAFMLTFYAVPEGLIAPTWVPSPAAIRYLEHSISRIEDITLGGETAEAAELEAILTTPLGHLVPSLDGSLSPPPAATQVSYNDLLKTISELLSGPWSEVLMGGLFEAFERAVQEALVENSSLLIIRT